MAEFQLPIAELVAEAVLAHIPGFGATALGPAEIPGWDESLAVVARLRV